MHTVSNILLSCHQSNILSHAFVTCTPRRISSHTRDPRSACIGSPGTYRCRHTYHHRTHPPPTLGDSFYCSIASSSLLSYSVLNMTTPWRVAAMGEGLSPWCIPLPDASSVADLTRYVSDAITHDRGKGNKMRTFISERPSLGECSSGSVRESSLPEQQSQRFGLSPCWLYF